MAKGIKAKVTRVKVKTPKRKSRGVKYPWEVWTINEDGYHGPTCSFETEKEAQAAIRKDDRLPFIVHTDIPKVEY